MARTIAFRKTYRLGVLNFQIEHREPHIRCGLGAIWPTLEYVAGLTCLPVFWQESRDRHSTCEKDNETLNILDKSYSG